MSFFKKPSEKTVAILIGAFFALASFVVKDVFHEYWQKRAEALDTAQYMYSLSSVEADSNVGISLLLTRLDQLKEQIGKNATKKEPPVSGEQVINYPGSLSEIARLKGILTTTMILAHRLPQLKDLEKESEEYGRSLEAARGELEFLRSVYLLQADKFVREHEPWRYAPKRPLETYRLHLNPVDRGSKQTAWEATLKSDDQYFDLLRQDVDAFKNETIEKAQKVRESDERWSLAMTVVAGFVFVGGWLFAIWARLKDLPGFSAE